MTPEQEEAVRQWRKWEDEWDWENEPWVGGIWFLRGLGYPPDLEKLAEQEAEIAAWVAAGRPMPPEPTPEERLKAQEEAVAQAAAQGIPIPPNYLQVVREEAARARRELDQAAAACRTAPFEPIR